MAVDSLLVGLRELERLGSPAPALKHDVRLWFAAPLAKRLTNAGVRTLGELMALANDLGASWWRRVPRVGRLPPRPWCVRWWRPKRPWAG
ncbi:phage integrase family protein [Ralstonia pseudosolanacearum]|uniref:phage integrase family protein n=1 Tax=Ralstonia pseudosolanacearum TaxID=1310165 RepID=UPI00270895BD|nr:phage integrase family protein [Ralstonia pseudosolanacearum]MDO3615305.1 phage integrase family protein [Ralstonia pseudosolanacearum]